MLLFTCSVSQSVTVTGNSPHSRWKSSFLLTTRVFPSCFLLQRESSLEKTPVSPTHPGSLDFSLESLNQLNHSSSNSLYPDRGSGSRRGHPPADGGRTDSSKTGADPAGSLSDSLYDSFSSCTSQGSNDV